MTSDTAKRLADIEAFCARDIPSYIVAPGVLATVRWLVAQLRAAQERCATVEKQFAAASAEWAKPDIELMERAQAAERERDDALATRQAALNGIVERDERIAALTRERDEARAVLIDARVEAASWRERAEYKPMRGQP